MCVVARHTKARNWVDREVVADLDRALHLGGDSYSKILSTLMSHSARSALIIITIVLLTDLMMKMIAIRQAKHSSVNRVM